MEEKIEIYKIEDTIYIDGTPAILMEEKELTESCLIKLSEGRKGKKLSNIIQTDMSCFKDPIWALQLIMDQYEIKKHNYEAKLIASNVFSVKNIEKTKQELDEVDQLLEKLRKIV